MPIFYLSNLNPGSTALTTAGEFGGSVTSQPVTNSTTRVINVTTATAQAFFKFYMSGGRVGVSSGSNGTLTFTTPDTTRSDEFLQLLATEVFGSSESSDLFSNKGAIVSSWDSATATALGLLNGLINTAGASASLELVNAMFHTSNGTINRFTMSYGFIGSSASPLVTGTGYAITGGSGSGAKVNVTMNSAVTYTITAADNKFTLNGHGFSNGDTVYFSSITTTTGFSINTTYYIVGVSGDDFQISSTSGGNALALTTDGSAQKTSVKSITVHTSPTSGAFAKGETITITDGSSNTATIALNSYQAASLNGTLANNAGTEVPLETGDVIRVLYTITSKTDQEDTSGDAITATQTFFADYTLN